MRVFLAKMDVNQSDVVRCVLAFLPLRQRQGDAAVSHIWQDACVGAASKVALWATLAVRCADASGVRRPVATSTRASSCSGLVGRTTSSGRHCMHAMVYTEALRLRQRSTSTRAGCVVLQRSALPMIFPCVHSICPGAPPRTMRW